MDSDNRKNNEIYGPGDVVFVDTTLIQKAAEGLQKSKGGVPGHAGAGRTGGTARSTTTWACGTPRGTAHPRTWSGPPTGSPSLPNLEISAPWSPWADAISWAPGWRPIWPVHWSSTSPPPTRATPRHDGFGPLLRERQRRGEGLGKGIRLLPPGR